jgi:hypothetical protein
MDWSLILDNITWSVSKTLHGLKLDNTVRFTLSVAGRVLVPRARVFIQNQTVNYSATSSALLLFLALCVLSSVLLKRAPREGTKMLADCVYIICTERSVLSNKLQVCSAELETNYVTYYLPQLIYYLPQLIYYLPQLIYYLPQFQQPVNKRKQSNPDSTIHVTCRIHTVQCRRVECTLYNVQWSVLVCTMYTVRCTV